jgi:predicted phosphodiesterase
MKYQYSGLIRQNIAPAGAVRIGVYDADGKRKGSMALGRLTRPQGGKRFSFGLISDLHVTAERTETSTHFDKALAFFEAQGCAFCAHGGDMTNIGFWYNQGDTEIYLGQFAEYKRICDLHPNLPVYGVCGNHENYNKSISENLTELEQYTGHGLFYTIEHGGELFVFIGQDRPSGAMPAMNDAAFAWLKNLLETNTGKRCHVFTHYFVADDSGSTKNCYTCYFGPHEAEFKALMAAHGRAIHYHGHSHIKFQCQEIDKATNYTERNGFPSVHIPSVGESRNVVQQPDGSWIRVEEGLCSQGYVVDVYDDRIVLNGWDFLGRKSVALGTMEVIV